LNAAPRARRSASLDRVRTASAEAEQIARIQAGDAAACEQFVREHTPRMLAVARRMLRQEEDARDAVQDAFLSAFRSLARFDAGCMLGTWLHRITVNAALMKLRSKRRRSELNATDVLPQFSPDGHFRNRQNRWQESCERELERRETRASVREAIERLPDVYRTVLLMRDIAGISTEDTAADLGITPNAVRIRLHRAHQALRELLDTRFRGAQL